MSLKFFLKAYARIAAIAAAVVLVCVLLFNGINSVREQYWHEQAMTPVMRWLAAAPDPLSQYHWMAPMFGLHSGVAADFGLSQVALERLGYGLPKPAERDQQKSPADEPTQPPRTCGRK